MRQFNTRLRPGDLVFFKLETTTESEERNRAARGAAIGHHKLRSKATGPYQVGAVTNSTDTIMRDGLADKVSKERVVRAPEPIRQDNGEAAENVRVNPADSTTADEHPPSDRRLTGSIRDAVLYPANRAIGTQAQPAAIHVLRRSSRETTAIKPSLVLDSDKNTAVPSTAKEEDPSPVLNEHVEDRVAAEDAAHLNPQDEVGTCLGHSTNIDCT